MQEPVRIIPLGGLGEVGKNMTVFESGGDLILIDAGLTFPKAEMHGIDLVLPDFSYVIDRADRLRAIVLTHGHEDHVGALPYLLRETGPGPVVFGTRLTLGLIKSKLDEHGLGPDTELVEVTPDGSRVDVGPFQAEFVRVTHSIPDAVAVVLHTAHGPIIHTGDFKLDLTPVDGRPVDIERLRSLGDAGVALLMSDSTNAENPGTTPSEMTVGPCMREIIAKAPGRVIVTSFASQIHRLQQVIDAADANGRKVCVIGRSMVRNLNISRNLGYANVDDDILVKPKLLGLGAAARGGGAVHRQPGRAPLGADADRPRRPPGVAGAPHRHGRDVVQGGARQRGERGGDGQPSEPDGRHRSDREQRLRERVRARIGGRAANDAGAGAAAQLRARPR